jgi:hypothetical protein
MPMPYRNYRARAFPHIQGPAQVDGIEPNAGKVAMNSVPQGSALGIEALRAGLQGRYSVRVRYDGVSLTMPARYRFTNQAAFHL